MKLSRLILILGLTTAMALAGGKDKIAKELAGANGEVDVIVQFRDGAGAKSEKVRSKGGKVKKAFSEVNAVTAELPASALAALAEDPDVDYVAPNRKVSASNLGTAEIGVATTGAPQAWSFGYTGKGIGIAVIDSGIASNVKDLGDGLGQTKEGFGRVVYRENFLVPAESSRRFSTDDKYGHGTHVAGILAGNGFLSSGTKATKTYRGVAPEAHLIDLQVLNEFGEGSDAAVIEAIDRAIELRKKHNIRVINLSLGRRVAESFAFDPLCRAVQRAWKAGIVVVVAAGNEGRFNGMGNQGYGTISAPGNDPFVITVGAMKTAYTADRFDDELASYSSKGPTPVDHIVKPDVVAPGNRIVAAVAEGYLRKQNPQNIVSALQYLMGASPSTRSSYFYMNGTSMATPMVSGAAALLLHKDRSLTPDQVKARLMRTASKTFRSYSTYYNDLSYKAYLAQLEADKAVFAAADGVKKAQDARKNANSLRSKSNSAYQKQLEAEAKELAARQALAAAEEAVPLAEASLATAQQKAAELRAIASNLHQEMLKADAAVNAAALAAKTNPNKAEGEAAVNAAKAAYTAATNAYKAADATASQAEKEAGNQQKLLSSAQNNVVKMRGNLQKAQTDLAKAVTAAQNAETLAVQGEADAAEAEAISAELSAKAATLAAQVAAVRAEAQAAANDPANYFQMQYDIFSVGAGYVDIGAALADSVVADKNIRALSPVAYFNPETNRVEVTSDFNAVCGGSALWGTSALWGYSALWGTDVCTQSALWGTSALWGSSALWGTSAVWGTQIFLNGSSALWGTSAVWGTTNTAAFNALWGKSALWGTAAITPGQAMNILVWGDFEVAR